MSATVPVLLLTSAGVGLAHSALPDHWLPLAVAGRARRQPLRQVARLSLAAGVAHVAVSVVLGAVVVLLGLSLRSLVESATGLIVGGVLIATGIAFLVLEVTGRGHAHDHHHHHGNDHHGHDHHDLDRHETHEHETPRGLALLIPFGAAASPDLTILPVFLAAAAVSTTAAIGSLVVFTFATLATFVVLTTLAAAGAYQLGGPRFERNANTVTAVVLVVIGALVALGVL